jgi:hypothetical protein
MRRKNTAAKLTAAAVSFDRPNVFDYGGATMAGQAKHNADIRTSMDRPDMVDVEVRR